jgi:fatty-acyl-CoA synthase
VAIVRVRDGYQTDDSELLSEVGRHIARYKLPKAIIYVDEIVRSPSGKADYRWARQIAAS